jgi:hypothetical protein
MTFTVSQESRDKATGCLFDFQCQQNNSGSMCTVEKEINNYGVFIKNCNRKEFCSYRLSYGFTQICLCPVRLEIFKKYRV